MADCRQKTTTAIIAVATTNITITTANTANNIASTTTYY